MKLIRTLSTTSPSFESDFAALRTQAAADDESVDQQVAAILKAMQQEGDVALLRYTNRFDRRQIADPKTLEVSKEVCLSALENLPSQEREALTYARDRILKYHQRQLQTGFLYEEEDPLLKGASFGQKITPIEKVGLYVPGGKAAYPSSVLMNAVPAKVAGVTELIMVVPAPDDHLNPLVLAAAALAGVDRVFTIGGAQAIGALAYGTHTIPAVDKIVGPGNAYVAAAKRRVFGKVGIDMVAGPSEILIISDGSAPPKWTAMDLFSQAEHDERAQAILLCPDEAYLNAVLKAIAELLPTMPRRDIIEASLQNRGALIFVKDLLEACALSNRIAPEHLELSLQNPEDYLAHICHAGAIFMGIYASEALGDYCAGTNHVLPTAGSARFSSPLGVYDFQKRSSLLFISQKAAQTLGKNTEILASGEGLSAHAYSASMRRL